MGLAQLDAEGRIVLANERLCAILGYARDELAGRTFRDVSHPEDREASGAMRARMYAGEIQQFSLRKRYLRKDGETVWVQVTAALVRDAAGAPQYEITAFEDDNGSTKITMNVGKNDGVGIGWKGVLLDSNNAPIAGSEFVIEVATKAASVAHTTGSRPRDFAFLAPVAPGSIRSVGKPARSSPSET